MTTQPLEIPERPIDLIQTFRTPLDAFEHFNLPVSKVPNVRAGNTKKFSYKDSEFPRVELVAKKFYEDQGCIAVWSEGVAFDIIRKSTSKLLCSELCKLYIYHENITHSKRSHRYNWDLSNDKKINPIDLGKICNFLIPHIYFDLAGTALPEPPKERLSYFNAIVKPEPLFEPATERGKIAEFYSDLISSFKINFHSKLSPHLKEEIHSYSISGNDKYGSAPYLQEFIEKLVIKLGYSSFFNELEAFEIPCSDYDLTVFDIEKNILKFVEVKNKDKLTNNQAYGLIRYLKNPAFPIELCIVNISKD